IAWHNRSILPFLSGSEKLFLREKRVLIRVQLLNRELVMKKGFLDKVEDNAAVRIWFEKTQQEKGDSLTEGYMLEL
ncbi:hypothetical protein Gotri_007742, partial [Gossypium trilobum]|nr:hypothetical protein [Gossypium trilobum]